MKAIKMRNLKENYVFANGDVEMKDEDGFFHLFRNGVNITGNIKAVATFSHPDFSINWYDEDYKKHTIKPISEYKFGVKQLRSQLHSVNSIGALLSLPIAKEMGVQSVGKKDTLIRLKCRILAKFVVREKLRLESNK